MFYVFPITPFHVQIVSFILSHPFFREKYFFGDKQYITTLCRLYFQSSTDQAYQWLITAFVNEMSLLCGYVQCGCIVVDERVNEV